MGLNSFLRGSSGSGLAAAVVALSSQNCNTDLLLSVIPVRRENKPFSVLFYIIHDGLSLKFPDCEDDFLIFTELSVKY